MKVTETILDGDPARYEQRFSVRIGSLTLRHVRRPVSIIPDEGTVCLVDNGPRLGTIPRQCAGVYRNGKWSRVKFEPTHWTHWEDLPSAKA